MIKSENNIINEKDLEIARILKDVGVAINIIVMATGISKEEIEKL